MRRIRIIGVGNEFRGDDAAGLLVARMVRARLGTEADVLEAQDTGPGLVEQFAGLAALIVVDGVRSGRPVGTILRSDVSRQAIAAGAAGPSTHGLTVADAIELGRALGVLPPVVVLYGIELGTVGPGCGVSPEVTRAIPVVSERILQEVEQVRGGAPAMGGGHHPR